MIKKKVCILIVNFNGFLDTIECLNSVLKSSFKDFILVVIDNSNNLDYLGKIEANVSVSYNIETQFFFDGDDVNSISSNTKIIFIKSLINKGFAAANNVGVKFVRKYIEIDYFWFLNNDTIIAPTALSLLYNYASKNSNVGMLGAKVLNYDFPNTIQSIGYIYNPKYGITKAIGKDYSKEMYFANSHLDFVSGASMFVSNYFINTVGLMSEQFFLYGEELDWCLRSKKFKFCDIDVCQDAYVYHKGGQSINKGVKKNPLSDFYGLRSRLLITKIYYPQYKMFFLLLYILLVFKRFFLIQFKMGINLCKIIYVGFFSKRSLSDYHINLK